MARWEFKLPDMGEGVTEGEIVAWHIQPGDAVTEDQPMVEIMTDKATVTITSPRVGRVLETHGAPGTVVQIHGVLVVFDLDAGAAGHESHAHPSDNPHAAPHAAPMTAAAEPSATVGHAYFNDKPLATPATRKLARDMNIDLRAVPPTGSQGRVTKSDVETFVQAPAPHAPADDAHDHDAEKTVSKTPAVLEVRVPLVGIRRKIAQKMAHAKRTAAHFTFVEECDATALKALRARLKPQAEAHGVRLTFLPFVVKAVVAALKKYPILNSSLDETTNEIVYHKIYNIGMAASTESGLLVPVIKEADRRSLLEVAREVERLAGDAKSGKSKLEDLSGSTFTITSLGAESGLFATPILNFPEVGILGVHQMKQKPMVRDGQIVIGDVMLLSLSFDHRIVDGHVGAAFAYEVIRYLQDPDRLFLEMA